MTREESADPDGTVGTGENERNRRWASTMAGHGGPGITLAHVDSHASAGPPGYGGPHGLDRSAREAAEAAELAPGASRGRGQGAG